METTNLTFAERLRARIEGRKIERNEKGLALLDVLIGIAIFALIAIIAVTAINQYRMRAYESGAVSDVKQVALQLEADFTDNNAFPADVAAVTAAFTAGGGNLTSGNTIADYTLSADGESYTVCVEHSSGGTANAFAEYDSTDGTVTDKGRGSGC